MPVTPSLDMNQLQQLALKHGGHAKQYPIGQLDPTEEALGATQRVRFEFKDGTYIDAAWNAGAKGWQVFDASSVEAVDKSNAQTQAASEERVLKEIGGKLYKVDNRGNMEYVQDVPMDPVTQAQLAAAQRNAMPDQIRAFQDYEAAMDYVTEQLKSGKMSYGDADLYMEKYKDIMQRQLDATLSGTTAAKQVESDRTAQMENQSVAAQIANQKATQIRLLGDSFMDVFLSQLKNHPKGTKVDAPDFYKMAEEYVNQWFGDQGVTTPQSQSAMGQGLLNGASGQPQEALPTSIEEIRRRYPELAGGGSSQVGAPNNGMPMQGGGPVQSAAPRFESGVARRRAFDELGL